MNEPSLTQLVQNSSAEFVCLNCTLPECEEGTPGCLYEIAQQAEPAPREPQQVRKRYQKQEAAWRRAQGKKCPVCGALITDRARACRRHAHQVSYA